MQQTVDKGLRGPDGPDAGFTTLLALAAGLCGARSPAAAPLTLPGAAQAVAIKLTDVSPTYFAEAANCVGIGAVAYTLNDGSEPIVGVTPAETMKAIGTTATESAGTIKATTSNLKVDQAGMKIAATDLTTEPRLISTVGLDVNLAPAQA